jgi:hypothetical protein
LTLATAASAAVMTCEQTFEALRADQWHQVDEVVDFTVLRNAVGTIISEVLYTYSPNDVYVWVSSFDMQSAFPHLAQQLARKQQRQITVVLINNGWQADAP